ncbi:hypothetical protein ACGFX4_31670 [Kitasatospora sp. NPDC048365]|uniref:hypothetical protein n=1 Tax=Kitasatospora sp. NPDC048365 TaxID=3364050 RepID=UPI00371D02C9
MSNDEPAWYEAEATARVEPAHLTRVEGMRIGTVAAESVPAEPMLQARMAEVQAEPMQRARLVDAMPAEPTTLRAAEMQAEPLQAMSGRVAAEPLQAMSGTVPAEPLQAMSGRVAAEPLQAMSGRVAAEPLQAVSGTERLQDGLTARTAVDAVAAEPLRRMSGTVPAQAAQRLTAPEAGKRRAASGDGGGGAGQGFRVDPEQYRAAVSPLLAASEQVRSLYTSLSAFLPSLEAQNPWGNDESGKKFAEGEKGYLKYSKDTLEVVKGLPDALKGIADGIKAMAESYENADESITSDFNGMDTGANPIPQAPTLPSAPVNNPVHIPVTPRITQSGRH